MKHIRATTSNLLPFSKERTAALQSKPKRRKNTSPTNKLTNDIRGFIARNGGFSLRCNVAGFYREDIGYIKSGSTIGTPDILAVVSGRFVGIEIKIGRDRQSDEQKSVQAGIEAAGGVYLLACGFEQFKAEFEAIIKNFSIQ